MRYELCAVRHCIDIFYLVEALASLRHAIYYIPEELAEAFNSTLPTPDADEIHKK